MLPIIGILTILVLNPFKPTAKVNIRGRYVLITGCDSGFGRATAIQLDKMRVCALATCLTKEGEQSLKSATSNKLKTFQLDVTNAEQIKRVFDEIKKLVEDESGRFCMLMTPGNCHLKVTHSSLMINPGNNSETGKHFAVLFLFWFVLFWFNKPISFLVFILVFSSLFSL